MAPNMSLFSVNAILLLSTDDRTRILTKYYNAPHHAPNSTNHPGANPYPTVKEQKAFEKGLLEKTNKQSSDIILYDGRIVVFKMEGDVMMYVVGGPEENEILLFGVVLALRDSLAILLKNSTDKRTLIENYDLVSLAIDEIVDDGIILEVDPVVVASRVSRAPAQDVTNIKGVDFSEEGLQNLLAFGKNKIAERLRQGL
ncbi:Golgi-to-ER vesicle coat component [Puttea exsequens]|nr:Golgi-to-ER vesicle coat component [Puttea exsequens]